MIDSRDGPTARQNTFPAASSYQYWRYFTLYFDCVARSAWWALATLTTIGYGDIVPITPWGKVFGGVVMLFGLGMFALPVAILATGFSQESTRHQFVVTWGMIARVPLFGSMDYSEIAEITKVI